eukprot:2215230-Rhodomonas_salina.1
MSEDGFCLPGQVVEVRAEEEAIPAYYRELQEKASVRRQESVLALGGLSSGLFGSLKPTTQPSQAPSQTAGFASIRGMIKRASDIGFSENMLQIRVVKQLQ